MSSEPTVADVRMVQTGIHFFLLLAAVGWTQVAVATPKQPTFLPDYFSPAFEVAGGPLLFAGQSRTNSVDQFTYESADHAVGLTIEKIDCSGESAPCASILNN